MTYILNGTLMAGEQISLPVEKNGSFWYGDGFFEAMKWTGNKINFLEFHWERIVISCSILKMKNPFSNIDSFGHFVNLLAEEDRNPVQRIKLICWRHSFNAYQPEDDQVEFLLTTTPLSDINYSLNNSGLKVGIYSDNLKQISKLGNIKSTSSQLYVLATLNAQTMHWDDSILLNNKNHVIETSRSNIFIVSGGVIYTPPLNEGCLDGIMRRVLLEICNENNIPIQQESISIERLKNAEEVFLTGSIRGIQWVSKVNEKTYSSHQHAIRLSDLLNKKF